jgi:hypothetical protein
MVLIIGIVWGGFVTVLTIALKKERAKGTSTL